VAPIVDSERVMEFKVTKKTVDGTYMHVEVPATHPPRYEIVPGVHLVPPNALVNIKASWDTYTIIDADNLDEVFLRRKLR
jgi:hypothetical protein